MNKDTCHWRPLARIMAAIILVCTFTGCAAPRTISVPSQLTQLPKSTGVNGGSFGTPTNWEYRGSDNTDHHFHYWYHTDNLLRRVDVKVPKTSAVMSFPESKNPPQSQWAEVETRAGKFHIGLHKSIPSKFRQ